MSARCGRLPWMPLAATALFAARAHGAEFPLPACLAGPPVPITVRIGDGGTRSALLRGGASPPLEIVDAQSLEPLWSAAAWPPASQQFDALAAQFAGSLLPIDLDGDGLHDRIYAGDLAGRLWRFDLHHGNIAGQWATGGVFADLSAGAPRGFTAPPDVSLAARTTSEPPWFNIALGTVRLGTGPADNRFYVLRDAAPFESWSQARFERWRPLVEGDLVQLSRPGDPLTAAAPRGYFIVIGSADIISPSITTSGRATLAMSAAGSTAGPGCSITAVVSSVDLATGIATGIASPNTATGGTEQSRLVVSMTAGEPFMLQREGGRAICLLGQARVPACDVDLSPRRSWWRREDAD